MPGVGWLACRWWQHFAVENAMVGVADDLRHLTRLQNPNPQTLNPQTPQNPRTKRRLWPVGWLMTIGSCSAVCGCM